MPATDATMHDLAKAVGRPIQLSECDKIARLARDGSSVEEIARKLESKTVLEKSFDAALLYYDAQREDGANTPLRTAQRALYASLWFIENVSDQPGRDTVFFRVRTMARKAVS